MNENTRTKITSRPFPEISREAYFEEQPDNVKIGKLAEALECSVREIRDLRRMVLDLREHMHTSSGDITVPLGGAGGRRYDEGYFYRNPLGRDQASGRGVLAE